MGEPGFTAIVELIEEALDGNAEMARRDDSEIIAVARELGMYPEPTGTGPHHWRSRCPETNHGLYIHSGSNTFGCGYCCRNGGPEELRQFVYDRKESRRKLREEYPVRNGS